jgi:PAS domain S-box-containing protein
VLRASHDELETRVAERAEALLKERRLLRTLIDNLPDAIYAKDAQGRKTLANPADLHNFHCATEAEALGKTDFDLFPPQIAERFFADDMQVIKTGTPVINREEYFLEENGKKSWLLSSKLPLHDEKGNIVGLIGIGRNITSLKAAESKLEAVHKELLQASRQAGMAEVATGVLHNVGNVLNSVNVSAALIAEKLRTSKVGSIIKLARLVQEHEKNLVYFLSEDERGQQIPAFLHQVAEHLEKERLEMAHELTCLTDNIDHIKQIVTTQQDYARVAGMVEEVKLSELVEDAIKIHGGAYMRHGVTVIREYDDVPKIKVDKHRVMQILVNLLSNAKYACDAVDKPEKQVTLRIRNAADGHVQIQVQDNGQGVSAENLVRIFSQGFTTRKGGHGFGLHSGALAAHEMGGSLTVQSEGPGLGATFTVELPPCPPEIKPLDKTTAVY